MRKKLIPTANRLKNRIAANQNGKAVVTIIIILLLAASACLALLNLPKIKEYARNLRITYLLVSATPSKETGHNAIRHSEPADTQIPANEELPYLDSILKEIFPGGWEKIPAEEKAIEILRYSANRFNPENNSGTATKILKEGKAICGGVSKVFTILCRRAGIPARYGGFFYLPGMGSHAVAEVYFADAWHYFDPTFGIFFYSREKYDGNGIIPSLHDAVSYPEKNFLLKVLEEPNKNINLEEARKFGIQKLEDNFLQARYGAGFSANYREYFRSGFPVVYGENDVVSFPVDADLTGTDKIEIGKVDHSASDLMFYEKKFNGSAAIGPGIFNFSPYHTWLVKAPADTRLKIEYFSVGRHFPRLLLVPLRSVDIISVNTSPSSIIFVIRLTDPEGIFTVSSQKGGFLVDAINISESVTERREIPTSLGN